MEFHFHKTHDDKQNFLTIKMTFEHGTKLEITVPDVSHW